MTEGAGPTPGPPSRVRRRLPAWSLRTRLLASMVALLAAVSLVIGVVSVLALDRLLLTRLDAQVTAAVDRSARGFDGPRGPRPDASPRGRGGRGPLGVPGQAEGTLGARIEGGSLTSSLVLDVRGEIDTVPPEQAAELVDVPRDGRPYTVDLGPELGVYRVVTAAAPGGATFVTGLPLGLVRGPVSQLAGVVAAVGTAGLVLGALVGTAVIGRALAPLRRVAATATRVAEMPLDRGEVALAVRVPAADTDPRTEVGQVGSALNHLLDNVASALRARQASETRVRRFVADASHELGTPLAAIRGYAELTRRSHGAVPADVAHALRRVESEAVRMTNLVEDLLLLARLDAGRPVESGPVDLSALMVDVLGDAHAAVPGHRWTLDLPAEPVVVAGDGPRLHQAVANLLTNARVHTPPGTVVAVRLRTEPADGDAPPGAVLEVVDDGPGVPAALAPEVFERFVRGDGSRSRTAGSTGLGLAIAAAVVTAHGGALTLDSRPGRTTFTRRLPMPREGSEDSGGGQRLHSLRTG